MYRELAICLVDSSLRRINLSWVFEKKIVETEEGPWLGSRTASSAAWGVQLPEKGTTAGTLSQQRLEIVMSFVVYIRLLTAFLKMRNLNDT